MVKSIAVVGLGYVGLPLALLTAENFDDVLGIDVNLSRLDMIKNGTVKIDDGYAKTLLNGTKLRFANAIDRPRDIYIVCVPTPVNERNEPDLSPVLSALDMILKVAEDGQLIIVESTIYPGMCEDVIAPYLDQSGKKLLLAHCPERINPGDSKWNVNNIPRVVGGTTPNSVELAYDYYTEILDAPVKKLRSIRSAEASKVLENIFRDVNIALMNEMAQAFYRMSIDVVEVIEAASTKPFAFMPHWPGVGVGGHCIAVDPYYMIEKGRQAGFDHEFLKLARKINSGMPIYTVNLTQNALNQLEMPMKGTRVGVYGLSYKQDVGDIRESPSLAVIEKLRNEKKAVVEIYDPFIPEHSTVGSIDDLIATVDVLIICTAHSEIRSYPKQHLAKLKLIIDGRNCCSPDEIRSLGVAYKGIGIN